MKTKFGYKEYFKPTPGLFRRIGDALLMASTFTLGFSIIKEYKVVAIICLIAGVIGKFLTNFFAEDGS